VIIMPWPKGRKFSKEHREKASRSLKGHKVSKETRKKISEANKGKAPWNKGKHLTEEDKKRKSIAAKKRAITPEGKKQLKELNKASHTPEAEEKRSKSISKQNKKRYQENPQLGKIITQKAHERTRQMVKEGTHPFQKPENRLKAKRARSQRNYGGTWIERKIGWLLKEMNLETIPQTPIPYGVDSWGRPNHLFPDWFLPNHNLIIECDGVYWHQDEERQRERDSVFFECGYRVLHLTGPEIRKNLASCRKQIEAMIYS